MFFYIKKRPHLFVLKILVVFTLNACNNSVDQVLPRPEVLPGSSRLAELLSDGGLEGYAKATGPRTFRFPQDHGPHPAFRNEWWYVTGNLDGIAGERFGFELTFFRFSLTPVPDSGILSAWRSNQVYVGHFAVTDVNDDTFHVAQRYARGSVGLAGARADPFRVWLEDWSIAATGNDSDNMQWRLRARDSGLELDLDLEAIKAPVLNGEGGLSQKSDEQGNASYYYSLTRIRSTGTLRINGRTLAVSGQSWLDREWSSSALSQEQRGWDWFALQLSDSSELMFYNLRRNDGTVDDHSAGTFNDTDGNVVRLYRNDVAISVTGYWKNEQGSEYPAAWHLAIPSLKITLEVTPVMDDQELVTNVRYWEGAVDVAGTSAGRQVSGRGYVELTGYAGNQIQAHMDKVLSRGNSTRPANFKTED